MIYLDYAATTPMLEGCLKYFSQYGCVEFCNPSALYKPALDISNVIKDARIQILNAIGASEGDEIIFTSSGSEADNIAFFSTAIRKNGKVLVGRAEHSAVHNCALELIARGYNVDFVAVNLFGEIDVCDYESKLDENVCFVSIMHANNETGAVNDLRRLSSMLKKVNRNAIFHSDGVQALGKIPVDVKKLGVDLYSMSGHKINAPKGVGALYAKFGLKLKPFIFGGGQEKNIRSSTQNVPGIVSFAYALTEKIKTLPQDYSYKLELLKYTEALLSKISNLKINSNTDACNAAILSLALADVRGEVMLHSLEKRGIIIGTGSACSSSKALKRIPQALGVGSDFAEGMMRISIDRVTTKNEIDFFVTCFIDEYAKLKAYKRV